MRFFPGFLSKLLLAASLACAALLAAAETQPPRLSHVEGAVSFWRPGAPDWVEARINTPLALGDALYAGPHARLELELWGGGFVRAADEAQITLVNQTRDYLQLSTTSGRLALDFSDLPADYVVEVDTPHAVFTIERPGYYRVDVGDAGRFLVQERGAATLTLADGTSTPVRSGDEVVVAEGREPEFYAAAAPDAWDEWNFDRSEELADSRSQRYLPPGVAGAAELDRYGEWQVVQEYGPLWAPHSIPSGWVPYSSGRWIWDPHYQWTWVDDAPWGWAPFHYGRWVNVGGHWMWAPGAGRRAVYAPALVGFMGTSGGPSLGWVALGWGEPVYPWWGHQGFVGQPWWGGWGGPRADHHHHHKGSRKEAFNPRKLQYANARTPNAIVTTAREHFGRGHVNSITQKKSAARNLQPLQGKLPVKPAPERMIGDTQAAVRPPDQLLVKPVVATRAAQPVKLPWNVRQPALAQQRLVPGALGAQRATSRAGSREALPPAEQARELRGIPAPASNVVIPGRSAVTPQRDLEPSRPQVARPSSRIASPPVVPGRAEGSRQVPAVQGQQAPADYRGRTRGGAPGIAPNPVLENARSGRVQQERLEERRAPSASREIGRQEEPERAMAPGRALEPERAVEAPVPRPAEQARELLSMPPVAQPRVPQNIGPPVTVPPARTLPSGMNPPLQGLPPVRTPPRQQGSQEGGEPQGLRPPSNR